LKRFGLSSSERIRSKKEFDLLYSAGKTVVSADKRIKTVYFFEKNTKPEVKAAFAVSKKAGNAVWRNRVKRLLRVSYRLNKESLLSTCTSNDIFLLVVFSPFSVNSNNFKKINLNDVLPGVIELIENIRQSL